jgi:hypothetical protein
LPGGAIVIFAGFFHGKFAKGILNDIDLLFAARENAFCFAVDRLLWAGASSATGKGKRYQRHRDKKGGVFHVGAPQKVFVFTMIDQKRATGVALLWQRVCYDIGNKGESDL